MNFKLTNVVTRKGEHMIAYAPIQSARSLSEARKAQFTRFLLPAPETETLNLGGLIQSPTGNCQLYLISYFNQALTGLGFTSHTDSITEEKIRNFKDYIRFTSASAQDKPLLLVDVHTVWAQVIKALCPVIVSQTNYKSSNGSDMTIFILDTRSII